MSKKSASTKQEKRNKTAKEKQPKQPEASLATLSPTDAQTELEPAALQEESSPEKTMPSPPGEERRTEAATSDETTLPLVGEGTGVEQVEPPVAEPKPEALRLPRGAFIALRKSGGLKFSTLEVVVYPDGRVAYDARGVPKKDYNQLRRMLNDAQVLGLRHLLDQSGFWRTESQGQQNPDAFAYEIAARVGQRSNEIEVFDGSIPEKLQPLLERLTKLLPQED